MNGKTLSTTTLGGTPANVIADFLARQSSSRGENTHSIEDQVALFHRECERSGLIPGEIFIERDTSGLLPLAKRKGLQQAVERAEDGQAQVLVVAYSDRLTRDPVVRDEVVDRIEAKGGRVSSLDFGDISNATPMEWYSGHITTANHKLYALMTGVKLHTSKQANIEAGIPPFPNVTPVYQKITDDLLHKLELEDRDEAERLRPFRGRLRLHPINAPLFREAVTMRLDGKGWVPIAHWLNEQGARQEDGALITNTVVKTTLSSPLLVGEIHFGSFVPNLKAGEQWADGCLLDKPTFRRLQAKKATRGRYAKTERLLSRLQILKCDTCGWNMSLSSTTHQRKVYPYYCCSNAMCEKKAGVSALVAEETIRDAAIRLAAERQDHEGRATMDAKRAELLQERVKAETLYSNAVDLAMRGHSNGDTLDELKAEMDRAVDAHERLQPAPELTITADDWDAVDPVSGVPLISFDGKRRAIRSLIDSARVTPGRGPDRIRVIPLEG